MTGMNRRTGHKIMWALSIVYGVTVGIVATLGGPVGTVAWVGAVALGLGWTVSSAFLPRGDSPGQTGDA
jgi:hypothetical protein